MVDSVMATGMAGVHAGFQRANDAAQDIAQMATKESASGNAINDVTEAVVDLKVSELQVEASAKVVQTADDMMGTLINIKV